MPDRVLALEDDIAFGGHVQPADHVEDGRLARAVRANQAVERALLDREVEVADCTQAAEDLVRPFISSTGVPLRDGAFAAFIAVASLARST
jgi:hypothetical protein